MRKAIKIFLFLAVFAVITAGLVYFYAPQFLVGPKLEKISEQVFVDVGHIAKEVITPPPLRSEKIAEHLAAFLTTTGVINLTNEFRKENGLPVLKENLDLAEAAAAKLNDMFAKQYFEHVSPSGAGPSDWVERAGYDYIAIGENLAMGIFEGDKDLVEAWMNSPGHRANILSSKFKEIGVAVQKGVFEGREIWLAVQEFGVSTSVCSQPDENLKVKIETAQNRLDQMSGQLETLRSQIENFGPKRRAEYNEVVRQFNALVADYNNSITQVKTWVQEYNSQVRAFNTCASS